MHTAQQEGESVSNFVRRLERTFHVAYGRDRMSSEMKEAILYGQLQEGLSLELFWGPAVLGALGYKELCVAAKGLQGETLVGAEETSSLSASRELPQWQYPQT